MPKELNPKTVTPEAAAAKAGSGSTPPAPGQNKKYKPFPPRQLLFTQHYQKHHNATLAAIEAGYSKRSAHVTGHRLLNNVKLQQKIESYGQLGLDRLAVIASSNIDLAAERASEALVERAYGKAKSGDSDKALPNITINFNRINQENPQAKKIMDGEAVPKNPSS